MDKEIRADSTSEIVTFRSPSGDVLATRLVALDLDPAAGQGPRCSHSVTVGLDDYRRIDAGSLFHLAPAVRNPLVPPAFSRKGEIVIELLLFPDHWSHLEPHITDVRQAAAYLSHLGQTQPTHLLCQTESWMALSVTQAKGARSIGYETLWTYFVPALYAPDRLVAADALEAIVEFVERRGDFGDGAMPESLPRQLAERVAAWLQSTSRR